MEALLQICPSICLIECKSGNCSFISPIFVVVMVVVPFVCFSFFDFLFVCLYLFLFFFLLFVFLLFFLFLIIWGCDPFCDKKSNCVQYSNANSTIDFKSGAGLSISDRNLFGGFYCIIDCIVRILTRDVVELPFNAIYMIGSCESGESYPTLLLEYKLLKDVFLEQCFMVSLIFPKFSFDFSLLLLLLLFVPQTDLTEHIHFFSS